MGGLRYFTPIALVVSAVYAVLAVGTFVLVLGPDGYEYMGKIDAMTWASAAVCVLLVLIPYAILYAADQCAMDLVSKLTTSTITSVVAAFAAFVYFGSFRSNDGEYIIAYVIAPLIQMPLALVALAVSLKRQRRKLHAA